MSEEPHYISDTLQTVCAQMMELTVDCRLGTVKLDRLTAAHDVGKAINPTLVEGQIEGGVAQGIGMALMEDYQPGLTENLHDYLVPTFGDMPEVRSIIVEVYSVYVDERSPLLYCQRKTGMGRHTTRRTRSIRGKLRQNWENVHRPVVGTVASIISGDATIRDSLNFEKNRMAGLEGQPAVAKLRSTMGWFDSMTRTIRDRKPRSVALTSPVAPSIG